MDTVTPRDRRLRAFRTTDAFVVEVYRLAQALAGSQSANFATELRQGALRCGGAIVAACSAEPGGTSERHWLEQARGLFAELRFTLYLARRLGLIELRQYRGLSARQDAAQRELDALLGGAVQPAGLAAAMATS